MTSSQGQPSISDELRGRNRGEDEVCKKVMGTVKSDLARVFLWI